MFLKICNRGGDIVCRSQPTALVTKNQLSPVVFFLFLYRLSELVYLIEMFVFGLTVTFRPFRTLSHVINRKTSWDMVSVNTLMKQNEWKKIQKKCLL